jgi:hypothetical protein
MTKDQDQVHIFVRISEFYPWATAMILIDFFQLSNRPVEWGRCATCRLAI